MATVQNTGPVYEFLASLGIVTTKSVWPLPHNDDGVTWGDSCADNQYLAWTQSLQSQGFEIGLHNVSATSTERSHIELGLKKFKEHFGSSPKTLANHAECRDTIYWADSRFSGWVRNTYNLLTRFKKAGQSAGHVQGSPFFWGDLCKNKIRYVRNFVFKEINTLGACPEMPYHDPDRPYVNAWFASSNGTDVETFLKCVTPESINQLEESGGACIIYTHLARGFYEHGRLNPQFVKTMKYLAGRPGWFVPAGTLLDFLDSDPTRRPFTPSARARLERKWLAQKLMGAPQ